jgi:pyruvate dehydrogenase E1 component
MSLPDTTARKSSGNGPASRNGDPSQAWIDSLENALESMLLHEKPENAGRFLEGFLQRLRQAGVQAPVTTQTPYVNTIPPEDQPTYPGDRELERKIKSYARWNAMAMVVNANTDAKGISVGGHISSYASAATIYEVGYNHFFRAPTDDFPGDQVYFQGHVTPGNYARAFLEGRLTEQHLLNFRQELAEGGGLSSYPHPYLMPDFWQFPTVSMGLGPISSIFHARFLRYMTARNLHPKVDQVRVYAFVGDGESDEPESLGVLALAGREKLDNLCWVVNCNLQRLDGPVRGNSKIIQELEGVFRGAGWNVIKVIWGSDWDELFKKDSDGLLLKRMEECVDGDFQKYTVETGAYIRKHFFGRYPELLRMVDHLSDKQLTKMLRGGHDVRKVYTAFKAAEQHKGQPTVILAKTVKGYGMGESGEGRNITHQQKKLNEKELRDFRGRFGIPLTDEVIADMPFYRPPEDAPEMKYLHARRKALGGYMPQRTVRAPKLEIPGLDFQGFKQVIKGSVTPGSTTKGFVTIIRNLLRENTLGKYIVPIIPDEARTFGMDPMFAEFGIYSSKGQLYEPVDRETNSYYKEAKDGQILEEGISEAGAIASFIAAGTAYANHGVPMIPFYIYYSMFGFQRVGDQIWQAADSRAKGFMLGGTHGRTTLNGEGLQHQDGHSLLHAGTVPTIMAYDPAFDFETAVIIRDGLKRMYQDGEEIFYYLALYNEDMLMPAMPEGVEQGILDGLYKFKAGADGLKDKAHILGSGSIMQQALRAQTLLAEKYGVSADVWSATSYKRLRNDALNAERWNMLHPTEPAKEPLVTALLEKETGPFIAVSDNMKIVADQIGQWVPGGLTSLGTDGFGRSDSRPNLRRFFEIDAECTVVATLHALAKKGTIERTVVAQAIKDLGVNPEKVFPFLVV